MKKETKLLRCTLLNGSAWSTERKYMRRYKGKCDIFFGTEHRLRKEAMEEQFNKEARERCRFAANAARNTDEKAGIEDQMHTSRRCFCGGRQQPGRSGWIEGRISYINPRKRGYNYPERPNTHE